MTPIEELVRQALTETPVPTTAAPLTSIDRRVRRARRWLAAGAGAAAAAVVAAVVVPLAVLDNNNKAGNVSPAITPSPSTSTGAFRGVTQWASSGVVQLGRPNGTPLALVKETDETFFAMPGPNGFADHVTVKEPADYVGANGIAWVAGTDRAQNLMRVSVDEYFSEGVHTATFRGALVAPPVVAQNDLYALVSDGSGTVLYRFVSSKDGIDRSAALAVEGATEIAATSEGHVWAHAGDKLIEVKTDGHGLRAGTTVDWSGTIFGPTMYSPEDTMWAYDGSRLVELNPSALATCVSCAEGARIPVPSRPTAVAADQDDSLFVATEDRIYHYTRNDVSGGNEASDPPLVGVRAVAIGADIHGGLDFIDDKGALYHWDPQLS